MNYAKVEMETLKLVVTEGDEHGCAYTPLRLTWKGKYVPARIWSIHSQADGGYRLLVIPNSPISSQEHKDTLEDMRKDPQVQIVE